MNFSTLDFLIFGLYCVLILFVGLYVSRNKKGQSKSVEDYFLASKSLPWWAVGASLIAANISAEQFIGMSGSGFVLGLAIASYEWMAAITLIIVGKYFLPIFLSQKLYTIPQFIEKRFGTELKTILAIFWIALFVFVNLSSVLYLGSLALKSIWGVPILYGIFGLGLFAATYSLYGGLSSVAWTDVIQVFFLVLGGIFTTYLALNIISNGSGVLAGFNSLLQATPERFHMILDRANEQYLNLPGIWVLVGGLWVANLYYWGFNQYIIQRTLAAKSVKEAQNGIALAALLKLIIPFIVVLPGIACYVIINDPDIMARLNASSQSGLPSLSQADKAYPWLLQLLPDGVKGIALAALTAAIVSSLASMLNSTSTIFTMDIYKPLFNKGATETKLVFVGRISAAVALAIASIMASLLGGIDQAFQFIQEYTGIVSPGILAVFILGLFWKMTTNRAAIIGALSSIPIAFIFKFFTSIPWMNQMGLTALSTMLIIILTSYIENKGKADPNSIVLGKGLFRTGVAFNISAFSIAVILVALYSFFW